MNKKNVNPVNDFKDEMFNKTMYYQKKYGFKYNENNTKHASWNNEADAFKHAFMQAVGLLRYTQPVTYLMGIFHEIEGRIKGQPKGEENMDTWNNKIGREIGEEIRELSKNHKLTNRQMEDIAAYKIMERMRRGDLITHPSDKRQYKDYNKYMEKGAVTGFAANISKDIPVPENKIYYALEDVGKMSTNEFLDIEETINRQMEDGTMFEKKYFEAKVRAGEMIWVDEYIRGDGTKVKGHYRSKV